MKKALLAALIGISAFISGCGKTTSGDVSVESGAFSTSGNALVARENLSESSELFSFLNPSDQVLALAPTTTVTDFKFCVKKVKLENEDGGVEKKDDQEEIEFKPGLIDLSSGAAKSWGTMNIPVGFKLKKIKIKVQKDKDLCSVDYSIKFNSQTTTEDVEFKWKFEPAIELEAGNALTLAISSVVSALRSAGDAGTLANVKSHIEGIEESGSKK